MEDRVLQIYSKFCSRNEASKSKPSGDNSHTGNFNTEDRLTNDIQSVKDTFDSFNTIKTRVYSIDKNLNRKELDLPFSLFPFLRRLRPMEESKKDDNSNIKLAGLGILGLINLKEDLRDILIAFGRMNSNIEKGFYSVFKFFSGTLLEKPLRKTKWGKYILINIDKTVGETKFAQKFLSKIGIKGSFKIFKKEIDFFLLKKETVQREYVKFSQKPDKNIGKLRLTIGKIIGTTLHKMPLISLAFASLLEMPQIIKALKNNDLKQIPKSATSVLSVFISGALATTILAMMLGPAGGVFGLGLGMYFGNKVAKYINSKY